MRGLSGLFAVLFFMGAPLSFGEKQSDYAHLDLTNRIGFPETFIGIPYKGLQEYSGEGLGYSVRYEDDRQKLDIYVYDKNMEDLPDGIKHSVFEKESEAIISDIRTVEKHGDYRDVTIEQKNETVKAGGISFLRNRFEYIQTKKPRYEGRLSSDSYLTGWNGQFIKVRYTRTPQDPEKSKTVEDNIPAALAELLNNSGEQLQKIIQDRVLKAVEAFRKEPRAENPGKMIALYSMESDAVLILLSEDTVPWLLKEKKSNEEGRILFIAFLAGNLEAQLNKGIKADHSYEGALEVIRTYRQLQKENPAPVFPSVEKWMDLEEQKNLREYFESE